MQLILHCETWIEPGNKACNTYFHNVCLLLEPPKSEQWTQAFLHCMEVNNYLRESIITIIYTFSDHL